MKFNFHKAEFYTSVATLSQLPDKNIPEIMFSGRSNVGKSSIINKLLNRKSLARVSATPGKTITLNYYNIDDKLYFVDLPGYGYARRSKSLLKDWGVVVEPYIMEREELKLIIQLVDMRHKPSDDDFMMIDFLKSSKRPFVIVTTKSDKLNKKEYAERVEYFSKEFSDIRIIPFSIINGNGRDELMTLIDEMI